MIEKIAIWYLSRMLRKNKEHKIEIVIRSDGWTCYTRNKVREEYVKKTLGLIK